MLKERRSERARPAPAAIDLPAHEGGTAPHWKGRAIRHRRDVAFNEEHAPVLRVGAALAAEAAFRREDDYGAGLEEEDAASTGRTAPTLPVETAADIPNSLSGIVAKTLARAKNRQLSRLSRKVVTVPELEDQWIRKVFAITGQQHPAFTMKERGMLKNILKNVPINEPGATWPMVIDWLVEEWGFANGVARPYAFNYPDNVANIIERTPEVYHFLNHAADYLEAYIVVFFGQGAHPRHHALAEDLQARFVRACARARSIATVGHDRLTPDLLTDSELTHRVTDAAGKDIRADAALAERAEYRREYRERAGTSPRSKRIRQQLDQERVAHRVRSGWEENARSGAFDDVFPTQDLSGYFED